MPAQEIELPDAIDEYQYFLEKDWSDGFPAARIAYSVPAFAGMTYWFGSCFRIPAKAMIELKTKLGVDSRTAQAQLKLPFDLRQKSRLRTKLADGEDAWLLLPRGDILRGGDKLLASDGRIVEVISQPEDVLHVECADATALARAAYHLGNRHVPVQVGDGFLRIAADHVLADMLRGLGATLTPMHAPFEPEAGAYGAGGGHHHHSAESGPPGRIHEYQKIV